MANDLMGCRIPQPNGPVVLADEHLAGLVAKKKRGHPAVQAECGEHLAGGNVPEPQVVAGRGEKSGVAAKRPYRLEIAQRLPIELLAPLGVPVPEHGGFLDRPE